MAFLREGKQDKQRVNSGSRSGDTVIGKMDKARRLPLNMQEPLVGAAFFAESLGL